MLFALNRIVTLCFDLLLAPFGEHRSAGLLGASLACGALLALLYHATSDPARIRRTRDLFKARVLEMRLYPDDIVLITRALFGALAAQGSFLRAAARPMVVVALVAVPMFVQVEARYARAPLEPGGRTLVVASLKPDLDVRTVPALLTGTDAAAVDERNVRASAAREIVWRVDVRREGVHPLELRVFDRVYRFDLSALKSSRAIGHERRSGSLSDAAFHVGMPELGKESPLARVRVRYEPARYRLFGARLSWLAVFLVGTLLGAAVPARLLRVAL
jgi:hypothetical protein